MRKKIFVRALSIFAVGLLLCVVGAGASVAEFSSLKIVKAHEAKNTSSCTYDLPENEKLYIDGNVKSVLSDENIEQGKMVMLASYSEEMNVKFNQIQDAVLRENETDGKKSIKALRVPNVYSDDPDIGFWQNVKTALEHFKNKEIYYHTTVQPEYKIKVNPSDIGRIINVNEYDNIWIDPANYYSDEFETSGDLSDEYFDEELDENFDKDFDKDFNKDFNEEFNEEFNEDGEYFTLDPDMIDKTEDKIKSATMPIDNTANDEISDEETLNEETLNEETLNNETTSETKTEITTKLPEFNRVQ